MRAIRVLLVVLLVLVVAGCADECLTAESHCSGKRSMESCVQTDGFLGDHWGDEEDCPSATVCVDVVDTQDRDRRRAVCSSSNELDPRCPTGMDGSTGYLDTCTDAGTQLRCLSGYSREIPCEYGCRNSPDGLHGYCVK